MNTNYKAIKVEVFFKNTSLGFIDIDGKSNFQTFQDQMYALSKLRQINSRKFQYKGEEDSMELTITNFKMIRDAILNPGRKETVYFMVESINEDNNYSNTEEKLGNLTRIANINQTSFLDNIDSNYLSYFQTGMDEEGKSKQRILFEGKEIQIKQGSEGEFTKNQKYLKCENPKCSNYLFGPKACKKCSSNFCYKCVSTISICPEEDCGKNFEKADIKEHIKKKLIKVKLNCYKECGEDEDLSLFNYLEHINTCQGITLL